MKYIKELLGTAIVFGCEGNDNELRLFENLCFNYSISDKPCRLASNFTFITTSPEKLKNGLSLFIQNNYFVDKKCKAGGLRILAIQEAKKIIENSISEPFYSSYLNVINRDIDYYYKVTDDISNSNSDED